MEFMTGYKLKVSLLITHFFVVIILLQNSLVAQNLLANGNFEEINLCSEYGVSCAPEAWFRYPPIELDLHLKNVDLVYEGKKAEVVIVENRRFPGKFRLNLYSMLLCPLEAGAEYTLSFYLNPINDRNYKLEVMFTDRELIDFDKNSFGMKSDLTFVNEKSTVISNRWTYKEGSFVADGEELYINIGNFSADNHKFNLNQLSQDQGNEIAYLIDDIKLVKKNSTGANDCDLEERKKLLYATDRRHTYNNPEILPGEKERRKPLIKKKEAKKEIKHIIPNFAFGVDEYFITDEYYMELDELVTKLNTLEVDYIEIVGHTDDSGDTDYNQALSEKRANAIHEYLSEYIHVEYRVSGKGETEPFFPNTSEGNRSRNRRVVIEIHLKKD